MPTTATWNGNREFAIDFEPGESLVTTSLPLGQRPGPGASPMDLVQAAVVGCTGIDVVEILEKMRKPLSSLRIEVEATRRDEQPRIFTHLALVYQVEGKDLPESSVRRAVALSQEKYCSVAAMLRPTVELDYRIVLNGQELALEVG